MRLDGTIALVTGAAAGIGAATADALAAAGCRLLLVDADAEPLAAVAERTGGACHRVDLTDPDAAAGIALFAGDRIDLLVNNAGIGWRGPLAAMPTDRIERLVAVNLLSPMLLTRALAPLLPPGGGHLVFVGSIAGSTGVRDEAVYAATKAGTAAFAAALRQELPGTGVTVVVPGVVDTAFYARRGRRYERRWPRALPPTAVAAAIVRAVEHGHHEVFVPRWMRIPARLAGGAPTVFRAFADRFG